MSGRIKKMQIGHNPMNKNISAPESNNYERDTGNGPVPADQVPGIPAGFF
jgi:hypothetical protein